MAYTRTWDAAYEADPADATDDIGDGAGDIRKFKLDIRERMAHDHYMDIAGTDADHGEHALITLREQSSWGSPGANKAFFGTKEAGGYAELHFKDEQDNLIQITAGGILNPLLMGIPTGEIILFDKDTAVTGYTLLTDVNDQLPFISSGSVAGGETGGGAHSTGTWTQPNHTHAAGTYTVNDYHAHDRGVLGGTHFDWDTPGYLTDYQGATNTAVAGTSAGGATANTWRPACRVFTRQQRD